MLNYVKKTKKNLKPEDMLDPWDFKNESLLDFMNEIFSYGFSDAPNYTKLKKLLMKGLIDNGEVMNNIYDWIKPITDTEGDLPTRT